MAAAGLLSCYLNGPIPYVRRHITVNKMCASLNKAFPSFYLIHGTLQSIYIHHGYKYYSTSPLKEITKNGGGGGIDLLILYITGTVLPYPVPHKKNVMLIFYQLPLIFRILRYLLHKSYLKSNHRKLLAT